MKYFDSDSNLMHLITAFLGITGCFIVGFGLHASVMQYHLTGPYSPINHFISELGKPQNSSGAYILNRSLQLAGVLLMLFVLGFGNFLRNTRYANGATFFGVIATLFFSGIGHFTAETWIPHMICASVFFAGTMISVFLFSLAIWNNEDSKFKRVLSFHGFVIVVWYFTALLWPKDDFFQSVNDPSHFIRPVVWMLPMLEWGYCLVICSWILVASANMVYIARADIIAYSRKNTLFRRLFF